MKMDNTQIYSSYCTGDDSVPTFVAFAIFHAHCKEIKYVDYGCHQGGLSIEYIS